LIASHTRFTAREHLALSSLWFSFSAQTAALVPIIVPTQILLFVAPGQIGSAQQATFLSWLAMLGAAVSLIIPPIIGMLSDRTSSNFGRRRPYIIAGSILLLISTPLLSFVSGLALLVVGLALLLIGKNIAAAAYQCLVPDLVPKEQHGEASAYVGVMTILGNVAGLGLAGLLLGQVSLHAANSAMIRFGTGLYYSITAFLVLVALVITVFYAREDCYKPCVASCSENRERASATLRRWFVKNWIVPWYSRNFTIVFLTRFSLMLGLSLFMLFIEYYFAKVEHITNFVQATAIIAGLALLGGVGSALVLGILSDKVRRTPVVCMATICMGMAALAFVVFPGGFPLWPLGIFFGLGYGAYSSVDWALSIDSLPSFNEAGKDMGIWNASATLPVVIAPLLGSSIIALAQNAGQPILGYRLVFAAATFFLLIAAVFVLFVRERA
jgi:MFS family permease